MATSKVCCGCDTEKLLTEFHPNKHHSDGVQSRCKVCTAEQQRGYWRKDPSSEYVPIGKKRCNKCLEIKDNSEFSPAKRHRDGLQYSCKPCSNAYRAERLKQNPLSKETLRKYRENAVAARKADPDKYADPRNSKYSFDFNAMWSAQIGLCAACGRPMERRGKGPLVAAVDHDHSCCPGEGSCGKCVRGILHIRCNMVLGSANDSAELLEVIAVYRRKFRDSFNAVPCNAGVDAPGGANEVESGEPSSGGQ